MPIIKPISDYRTNANSFSELVLKSNEPVFITKNRESDMVRMSLAQYEKIEQWFKLQEKLAVAQTQVAAGDRRGPLGRVMKNLRARLCEHA